MSKLSLPKISRRRLMIAGAGTATAIAAATVALPETAQKSAPAPKADKIADQGGGYQETEHVLTYYKTARV